MIHQQNLFQIVEIPSTKKPINTISNPLLNCPKQIPLKHNKWSKKLMKIQIKSFESIFNSLQYWQGKRRKNVKSSISIQEKNCVHVSINFFFGRLSTYPCQNKIYREFFSRFSNRYLFTYYLLPIIQFFFSIIFPFFFFTGF